MEGQLTLQAYVHTEDERASAIHRPARGAARAGAGRKGDDAALPFPGTGVDARRTAIPAARWPIRSWCCKTPSSRLLALPVEVSYTLPEMLAALGSPFRYTRRDYYHFPLGHGLRAESLHAAWYRGQDATISTRSASKPSLSVRRGGPAAAVRERAEQHLFAWPPKFYPADGSWHPRSALSRLAFFARYESLLRCLAVREGRADARPTQVLLGRGYRTEAVDASDMEVSATCSSSRRRVAFRLGCWCATARRAAAPRSNMRTTGIAIRLMAAPTVRIGPSSASRTMQTTPGGMPVLTPGIRSPLQGTVRRRAASVSCSTIASPIYHRRVVRFLEELDQSHGKPATATASSCSLLRHPEEAATPLPLADESAALRGERGGGARLHAQSGGRLSRPLAASASRRYGDRRAPARRTSSRQPSSAWRRPTPRRPALPRTGDGLHPCRHREPAAQDRRAAASNGRGPASNLLLGKAKIWQGSIAASRCVPETRPAAVG